ncbi:TusE/DsrC/DsvC family sulfur relay protein [Candidatus Profftia sp. (ex Adelges kitamiensis)]|uniref:TusE/DsrC/DsvC family sulfur relay protein n=1 Tax=Candidatus Profftia sp. (ex Adelges kitamiensis) TaxID=2864218 RepID=UPI001CE30951|nr:TusE/DsrC/DsvC family sulfur relay protein [Candidatus Profftia sp. (ex Adelges kitamiensis)]
MLEFSGYKIQTDDQGYLLDSSNWSEDIVPLLANQEGLNLSIDHWEVIRFVRSFYLKYNTSPPIRIIIRDITKRYGKDKGNSCYLYTLFPRGPAKQAIKLAGLPKPVRCI